MTELGEWLDRKCAPEEEPVTRPRSQQEVEEEMLEVLKEYYVNCRRCKAPADYCPTCLIVTGKLS